MKYKNPFVDESAFEGDEGPKKSEDEILMEEAKQHTQIEVVETHMMTGMIAGLAAGAVVGVLIGKITTVMGIGMLVGLIVGLCIHKKKKE
ncbi:MAG: hypothetical protein IKY82_08110 [Alistipes sp.]|nr:hypothetical protein [Alistipes sp.]